MSSNMPVALFDSGVGGLTVLDAISKLLPNENLLYLGDTARVPYGTRSRETIIRYTLAAAEKLLAKGAKMLVIACNTATSAALETVRKNFAPLPVIGVIEPGASSAVAATRNKIIAVIGTEATINGKAYQRAISMLDGNIHVQALPCTLFVALAEEGWVSGAEATAVVRRYLGALFPQKGKETEPDTLLLGCTHFPLLLPALREVVGEEVKIVDSAQATAIKVREELERLGLLRTERSGAKHHFMITDNPERFGRTAELFLGRGIMEEELEVIDL